jgi:replication-associated recombination protein RarA
VSTGPIPDNVVGELQALGQRLAAMAAEDIPAAEADAMASAISTIRLQLKRLAADQAALLRDAEHRARGR